MRGEPRAVPQEIMTLKISRRLNNTPRNKVNKRLKLPFHFPRKLTNRNKT